MPETTPQESYFARVEDHFARRRGGPLVLSPKDWLLLEDWQRRGIPLPVVLRGINRAFDRFATAGPRPDRINSLRYCQQEVETAWEEHRAAHPAGANTDSATALPGAAPHLQAAAAACRAAATRELPQAAVAALGEAAAELEALAEAARSESLDARALDRCAAQIQERLSASLAQLGEPRLGPASLELPAFSPYAL